MIITICSLLFSQNWVQNAKSVDLNLFLNSVLIPIFNFFSALLRSNWQVNCKTFKVYNVMIWDTYTLWKCSHYKVNWHIHHLTCLFPFLSKFQLHSTVLSTIITNLYIRSSDLIHFTTESLYPFINFPYSPHPSTLGKQAAFYSPFYEFNLFYFFFKSAS